MTTYITSWESPSNIALVKYWGKKSGEVQIPANSSISFTLKNCATTTRLTLEEQDELFIEVHLEGDEEPSFIPKIEQFLHRISHIFPFVIHGKYFVETRIAFRIAVE